MRKNPHVRIRGGLGSVTALVYPTADRMVVGRRSQWLAHAGSAWRHKAEPRPRYTGSFVVT